MCIRDSSYTLKFKKRNRRRRGMLPVISLALYPQRDSEKKKREVKRSEAIVFCVSPVRVVSPTICPVVLSLHYYLGVTALLIPSLLIPAQMGGNATLLWGLSTQRINYTVTTEQTQHRQQRGAQHVQTNIKIWLNLNLKHKKDRSVIEISRNWITDKSRLWNQWLFLQQYL